MLTVGLRRDGNSFDAARLKRQFAYHFCQNRTRKKIMRAQMALDMAEDAAREWGTNEPLELPEIKRLKQLLPK